VHVHERLYAPGPDVLSGSIDESPSITIAVEAGELRDDGPAITATSCDRSTVTRLSRITGTGNNGPEAFNRIVSVPPSWTTDTGTSTLDEDELDDSGHTTAGIDASSAVQVYDTSGEDAS
jgi:hypothetical protein